jgi:cytochrome c biogenesis protein CcmG/thiol:disulfide interchange protein DsbE
MALGADMRQLTLRFGCAVLLVLFAVYAGAQGSAGRGTAAQRGTDIVRVVRAAINAQDRAGADRLLRDFRATSGDTPEALEALSWLGRAALGAHDLDAADRYASDTYALTVAALSTSSLENPHLEIALGAAIEVHALATAERGDRSEAVVYLREQFDKYHDTPIHKRIVKNLNFLSLEGKPALPLDATEYLDRPIPTFGQLRGKVVLLFFWAHWCPDCKAESPILARLLERYAQQGLAIVAPTQRYGYVARGKTAGPDEELQYIVQIRDQYYPFLRNQPVPVSEANHKAYGVSTTPTIVLVDRAGIVRLYHPGQMTEEELDAAIRPLLAGEDGSVEGVASRAGRDEG